MTKAKRAQADVAGSTLGQPQNSHAETALVVRPATGLAGLVDLARDAAAFAGKGKAASTRKAYASDVAAFTAWCAAAGLPALPADPATVGMYMAQLATTGGRKVATINRALVAISQEHQRARLESPTKHPAVLEVMRGIRRTLGTRQTQKAALSVPELRAMLATLPDDLAGLRDRALLLVGFAGAFRRSEIVALEVEDVAFEEDGARITVRRSKTDQEGAGREVGLPRGSDRATCPVRALRDWLEAAGVTKGPIFRAVDQHGHVRASGLSVQSVALVVKRAATATGLEAGRFAGHSLRAGLATAAAKAGKSTSAIMRQTGHRSEAMVRRYIRAATLFDDNAAGGIGL